MITAIRSAAWTGRAVATAVLLLAQGSASAQMIGARSFARARMTQTTGSHFAAGGALGRHVPLARFHNDGLSVALRFGHFRPLPRPFFHRPNFFSRPIFFHNRPHFFFRNNVFPFGSGFALAAGPAILPFGGFGFGNLGFGLSSLDYGLPYGTVPYDYAAPAYPPLAPAYTQPSAVPEAATPYEGEYYLNGLGGQVAQETGLAQAIADIEVAFRAGDVSTLRKHIDADHGLAIRSPSGTTRTVTESAYLDLTARALKESPTVRYDLNSAEPESGGWRVTGTHATRDPDGRVHRFRVGFLMKKSGDRWVIMEASGARQE